PIADGCLLESKPGIGILLPDIHRSAHHHEEVEIVQVWNWLSGVKFHGVQRIAVFTPELAKDAGMLNGNVLEDENSHSPLQRGYEGLMSPAKFITENRSATQTSGRNQWAELLGSYFSLRWRSGRRATGRNVFQPQRRLQPRLRKVDVTEADLVGLCLACPAETLFGHSAILFGSYRDALPSIHAGAPSGAYFASP